MSDQSFHRYYGPDRQPARPPPDARRPAPAARCPLTADRRPPTMPLNSGQCSENSVQRPLHTSFGPDHGLKHAGRTLRRVLKRGGGAEGAAPPHFMPVMTLLSPSVFSEHCFLNTGHCSGALPGDPISIVDR